MTTLRLLAIETSTHRGSVAALDEKDILYRQLSAEKQPSASILTMIEELLQEMGWNKTQIDAVSFGCGPGSFTGVRLATSVAQMMAFGLTIPVIPISTLWALAQQGWRKYQYERLLPALDASLNQLYWGCYQYDAQINQVRLIGEERLDSITSIKCPTDHTTPWFGIGEGWDKYPNQAFQWIAHCYPSAYDVALIARSEYQRGNVKSPLDVEAFYPTDQLVKLAS